MSEHLEIMEGYFKLGKSLSKGQLKTLNCECDMLNGNINRMCVCDTRKELDDMYKYAKARIDRIYVLNQQKFEGE